MFTVAYNPTQPPAPTPVTMPQTGYSNNNNVVIMERVVQQQPTAQPQIIYIDNQPQQQEEKKEEQSELEQFLACWYASQSTSYLEFSHWY